MTAVMRDGWTQVTVAGHERAEGEPGDGGRACAAVTAITNALVLGLHAAAQAYPDHVSMTLTEETS